jgi:transcriptional repressor NrdR
MVCTYCSQPTRVANSRLKKRSNQVWRRRTCEKCHATFTTYEVVDLGASVIVQSPRKGIQPFVREVLFVSIYESCRHRDSAIYDARELTQTIIQLLKPRMMLGILTRQEIIRKTIEVLERFDKAAATMYAAFHPL